MTNKTEIRTLSVIAAVFLAAYFMPVGASRFDGAVLEALALTKWYAREHVLLCLVPAFFIAGAISVFVSQSAVLRYLGAKANKVTAYAVASVSGTILAVCSCTVLPIFAGIYRRGAGLGPACAFLYSGPAINVLAIILTARVLGWEIGLARALGAILFAFIIGLAMAAIFKNDSDDAARVKSVAENPVEEPKRKLWQDAVYFFAMVAILVFANWGSPGSSGGIFAAVYGVKWIITGIALFALAFIIFKWFERWELGAWVESSWTFAKQILPLLLIGVLLAGFFLGRPGHDGVIPPDWISSLVGGNSIWSNLFAAVAGAFMYFATLTEIPILEGLIGSGMGKGPALSMLLAGPAVSLPNMLVIGSYMGMKKTAVFVLLVVVLATLTGFVFGSISS